MTVSEPSDDPRLSYLGAHDVAVDVEGNEKDRSAGRRRRRRRQDYETKFPRHLRNAPLQRVVHITEKSVAVPFLLSVVAVTFAIVLGAPFMIVLFVVFYPLALVARCVLNSCCLFVERHGCPGDSVATAVTTPVSRQDSFWLHDPTSITITLLVFEGGLGLNKVRDLLLRRVVLAENGRGHRLYPRFAQKVLALVAGYCWTDDLCFDVDNHVYAAPAPAHNQLSLEHYLSALANRTLPPDQPPWEVQWVPDYGVERDTVLIVRTHHCLSDGVSLVKILKMALADGTGSHGGCKQRFGGTTYPLNVFRAFIVGPMTFLSWLLCQRSECNLLRHAGQKLSGSRRLVFSDDISLPQVVRIKQVSRSTLNDVVLAALTGSLRSHFLRNGIGRPCNLKVNVAVDLRYESRSGKRRVRMGNKYAVVKVALPIGQEGAIPRLWEVRAIMDDLKTSADPVVMYGVVDFLETFLPRFVSRSIAACILDRATCRITNIPGPEHAIHAMSMRLKSVVCFVPPTVVSVPLSVTVTTNAAAVRVALCVDEAVLPQPRRIIDDFVSEIELMSQLLSSRRIPGEHRRRSYLIISSNNHIGTPSVEEVQNKLYTVQEELHEISQRLEESSLSGEYSAQDRADLAVSQQNLLARMERLKEEFSDLLLELRRRKSLADGVTMSDEDEDLDGEIRRPRKRTLSMSSRRASVNSVTSTARPLTTPSTSHHSSLATAYDSLETSSSPDHRTDY